MIDPPATAGGGRRGPRRLSYRLPFDVHALAVREPERHSRYLERAAHDSLALMESLVVTEGCPAD